MIVNTGEVSTSSPWNEDHPRVTKGDLCIARAGEVVSGVGVIKPIHGWRSLTYSKLEPALSILFSAQCCAPLQFQTRWIFSPEMNQ
jgi:hypothetical protein